MEISSCRHPQKTYFESSKNASFPMLWVFFFLVTFSYVSKLNHYELKRLTLKCENNFTSLLSVIMHC